MRNKHLLIILLVLSVFLKSCVGCSNSGRSQLIAKAREEASKKETIPEPNTIDKTVKPKVVKIEDIVTPSEKQSINKNETIAANTIDIIFENIGSINNISTRLINTICCEIKPKI